ncbi:serine hydrolase [Pollutibacter soli]|uniref:serine hydrolase n=1 Tax=Pollutibacter soli TaxID=3034157 RepID=UPI00301336A9
MRKPFLLLIVQLFSFQLFAQPKTDGFLVDLLKKQNDSILKLVMASPDSFNFQIIYTKIDRDRRNRPSFKNYYYHVDSKRYFNPASTVKMPLAFLALEKLNEMNPPWADMNSILQYDSGYNAQTREYTDSTSETGLPSIAQYIRKVLLVSDNEAYNRLYEFIGQQSINRRLHSMGYPETRITRRFVRMTPEENRYTNPIYITNPKTKERILQPMARNTDSFDFSNVHKMGRAYIDREGKLIPEPMDFTTHNNLPVEDLQQLLQSVMFPSSVPMEKRFRLTPADYQFLYQYLSQYPSETNYPKYDSSHYYDSYVKFYFTNSGRTIPLNIRVFNKVGWAYGCMTDVSYVADFENKIEYMITATIYVNKDGIMNDDRYEYETIALPWFNAIGKAIYGYELKRKRQHAPDLSSFKLKYEVRKNDGRKTIREVDN